MDQSFTCCSVGTHWKPPGGCMRSPQASFQGLQRGTQRKGFQESSLSLRRSQSCTQASLSRGQDIKHYQKSVCCFFFFLINSAPAFFFFFLIGSLNSVSVNCCDSYLNVIFFNTSVKELHASKFSISIAQPRQGPATTMEVNQSGYN